MTTTNCCLQGLIVFWSRVGSPPRIGARYTSMGALIDSARRAQRMHPNAPPNASVHVGGDVKKGV